MLTLLLTALAQQPSALHWPHWRGPLQTGEAAGALPSEFGDGQNLRWKVELPGRGVSTPLVLGERVYVTTAVASDGPTPPAAGDEGGRGGGFAPGEQSFEVHAYGRADGKLAWKSVACVATPHEG